MKPSLMLRSSLLLLFAFILFTEAVFNEKVIRIAAPLPIAGYNDTTYLKGMDRVAAFILAVDYLRKELKSQNITIKYAIGDSGTSLSQTSLDFTSGVIVGLSLTSSNTFKGERIHGLVGPGANIITEALSKIMYDRDILQVSYNSDASKLSHDADYPTHTRVSPSSSNQAVAIANTIYTSFSWRRVIVIYTDDIDGEDAFSVFQFRAAQLGIQIINSMMVNAGT
jgi:hypothetical protein